ncbi:hypothetical protein Xmau_02104 [Xenorhabdus mauleonii]|uniref:Uncharacterized protein n=1 Tax=Xenorhabdus mauleonii TaxID=351675 RepID=A0A1I3QK16_9GAMM|nr:hypothetical protein [Xenorhabdus mauleonii]PHM39922.1 hypothetical protein Xmau_02104 [Xenorhabdus mauleonii]SFJ34463.1 hypothetical protein SAMN05421680_107203 [Xenorhabdus mauleonii]
MPDIYDHCFVMLYYPEHINGINYKEINEKYNEKELPCGAWICDPWTEIACLAENYSFKWKEVMYRWATENKLLYLNKDNHIYSNHLSKNLSTPNFIIDQHSYSPVRYCIYNTIENSKKKILHTAILEPDGNIIIDGY